MKIAVAGKGGSGKTTIAGTLARLMAQQNGNEVLAIDGDSNPNLALTLGLSREQTAQVTSMPRSVLQRVTDIEGKTKVVLAKSPDEIIREFGVKTSDGVTLLVMPGVDHAGAG